MRDACVRALEGMSGTWRIRDAYVRALEGNVGESVMHMFVHKKGMIDTRNESTHMVHIPDEVRSSSEAMSRNWVRTFHSLTLRL